MMENSFENSSRKGGLNSLNSVELGFKFRLYEIILI